MSATPTNGFENCEEGQINSLLLDTSFLIRLLNNRDSLHENAKEYYRYFLTQKTILKCSTISIAEYCVKGKYTELPLRNLQILPFNFNHAVRAGEIMSAIKAHKAIPSGSERAVVINDINLFAQADSENEIDSYVTSDSESKKLYDAAKQHSRLSFSFIDIKIPCHEAFGFLPLK
jgi:predicted nucleic acid-binding protein